MTNKVPPIRMFPNHTPATPVVEEVKVETPVVQEVVTKPKKKAKE